MRSHKDCTKSIRSSTGSSSNPGGGEGIGFGILDTSCKRSISQFRKMRIVDPVKGIGTLWLRLYCSGLGSFLMSAR